MRIWMSKPKGDNLCCSEAFASYIGFQIWFDSTTTEQSANE
jgi:hypothetical protein